MHQETDFSLTSRKMRALLGALVAWSAISATATADWLVTADGVVIETDGPWEVKGRIVVFTDAKGTLSSLRLNAIDLQASEATTANGGPATASPPPAAEPEPERPPVLVLTNADVSRARELLGYEPIVSLADGLEDALAYYRTLLPVDAPAD